MVVSRLGLVLLFGWGVVWKGIGSWMFLYRSKVVIRERIYPRGTAGTGGWLSDDLIIWAI